MKHKNNDFNPIGATVLGMHDALVSLTGLIAGIAFTIPHRRDIVLTAIIASITAALSMAASNYLAARAGNISGAIRAGALTGVAYMITCVFLILPFCVTPNRGLALGATFASAIIIIFAFNFIVGKIRHAPWRRNATEMFLVCATVSGVAFVIGRAAQYFLGL